MVRMTALNTEGMLCPMPLLQVQKALQQLQVGDVLEVIASDPGTMYDIPVWCRQNEHEVIVAEEREGKFYFTIRKMVAEEISHPQKWHSPTSAIYNGSNDAE